MTGKSVFIFKVFPRGSAEFNIVGITKKVRDIMANTPQTKKILRSLLVIIVNVIQYPHLTLYLIQIIVESMWLKHNIRIKVRHYITNKKLRTVHFITVPLSKVSINNSCHIQMINRVQSTNSKACPKPFITGF